MMPLLHMFMIVCFLRMLFCIIYLFLRERAGEGQRETERETDRRSEAGSAELEPTNHEIMT